MESAQERRKFIRLTLDPALPVKFKIISSDALSEPPHEIKAFIKNISVGGGLSIEINLESEREKENLLKGKEKLRFEAGIPGIRPPTKVFGRVAWLKKMDKGALCYEAGVAFENIDRKTQEDILYAMIDLAFKQKNLKI